MGTGEVKADKTNLVNYWPYILAIALTAVIAATEIQGQLRDTEEGLNKKADRIYVDLNIARLEEKINAMKELQIRSDLDNNLQEILRRLPERRPSE